MTSLQAGSGNIEIVQLWEDNLEQEFKLIREAIDTYPYVSMDTECAGSIFPGIDYEKVSSNVRFSKLIQVGLTLSDENGHYPTSRTDKKKQYVWQFNYSEFDPPHDVHSKDSIDLLTRSGIDFDKNKKYGVRYSKFAELLMASRLVMNDEVQWITFQGCYDFGYLVKILTGKDLPEKKEEFFEILKVFFLFVTMSKYFFFFRYDVKYLIRFTNNLYGGLDHVGRLLQMRRVGPAH